MACWTFGELWYAVFEPETYPSMADLGYIAFYPLLYVGIVLLLRSRARTIAGTLWLDGATAALAAGAFGAAVIFELVADVTQGPTSVVVTNLAYPLGDVLLLSAVFGVFSLTGWRPGARWLLLGLGVLSTALADIVYLFQSAEGTYVEGTWIDILWPDRAPPHRGVGLGRRPHARRSRASKGARSWPFRPCAPSSPPGSSCTTTSRA